MPGVPQRVCAAHRRARSRDRETIAGLTSHAGAAASPPREAGWRTRSQDPGLLRQRDRDAARAGSGVHAGQGHPGAALPRWTTRARWVSLTNGERVPGVPAPPAAPHGAMEPRVAGMIGAAGTPPQAHATRWVGRRRSHPLATTSRRRSAATRISSGHLIGTWSRSEPRRAQLPRRQRGSLPRMQARMVATRDKRMVRCSCGGLLRRSEGKTCGCQRPGATARPREPGQLAVVAADGCPAVHRR